MVLEGMKETLGGIGDNVTEFISEKPITAAAIGAGVVGAGVAVAIAASSGKKSKRNSSKKGRSRDRKFISKQKHEQRYKRKTKGKRYKTKKHSKRKGVHYTKKGQPYIILSSGKAKFIKKTKRRNKK